MQRNERGKSSKELREPFVCIGLSQHACSARRFARERSPRAPREERDGGKRPEVGHAASRRCHCGGSQRRKQFTLLQTQLNLLFLTCRSLISRESCVRIASETQRCANADRPKKCSKLRTPIRVSIDRRQGIRKGGNARAGEGDGQVIVAQSESENGIARVVPVDNDSAPP